MPNKTTYDKICFLGYPPRELTNISHQNGKKEKIIDSKKVPAIVWGYVIVHGRVSCFFGLHQLHHRIH